MVNLSETPRLIVSRGAKNAQIRVGGFAIEFASPTH